METVSSRFLRDKTFSSSDVLRIWSQHLTRNEQDEVICGFLVMTRRLGGFVTGFGIISSILSLLTAKTLNEILSAIKGELDRNEFSKYDADF